MGLETVYGELLHLSGNNDITGITHYIITRYRRRWRRKVVERKESREKRRREGAAASLV